MGVEAVRAEGADLTRRPDDDPPRTASPMDRSRPGRRALPPGSACPPVPVVTRPMVLKRPLGLVVGLRGLNLLPPTPSR